MKKNKQPQKSSLQIANLENSEERKGGRKVLGEIMSENFPILI
jgi:hypothetical protein